MKSINFADLKALIEENSWTQNKEGVDTNGRLMQGWLEDLGMCTTVFHREHIGDHRLFSSSKIEGKPKLLLMGHLDTVFPPHSFEGYRENDEWIYGPGSCDMKGGNFVALSALRNVYAEHGQLYNVDFLLVSDEETGSDDSKALTRELAANYDACLDFEAAGENHEVVNGRKGVATYSVELNGVAAHAGNQYSYGKNANLAAAKLLISLTELTNIKKGSTINVGKIKGGISANTISPHAQLMVEARFTQTTEQQRILEAIPRLLHQHGVDGVEASLNGGLQRDVMIPSQEQQQLLDKLSQLLGYPLKTEQRGGVSDANVTSGAGLPTLDGFGPYGDGDHTEFERASKRSFSRRIDEVTTIVSHYSSPQQP
ncbi:M20 family metallopeptidase [Photobacterium chitinilyticum]|uniref:M20 family peptidase n=1 Tax=Photobacterium chitinilyticum TaxID=2485123 RepID=A0A444JT90_9GAMM|nr:M20 family metallopeptidase [Photobacterium chitinilyticum]RWX56337.1 M20 family peptidase [Photobacterium chitinilyticum]